ncbi:MAG: hypothetical protein JSR73_08325 [Proteobacteria bacterium]|nr:hypothetical protein [Pseudomonadota bacterium]
MIQSASTPEARGASSPGRDLFRWALPIVAALVAFAVDIGTPRGVVDGYLYVMAVFACVWVKDVRAALYAATALMVPMVAGYFLSTGDVPLGVALANRVAGTLVTWAAALLVWQSALLEARYHQAVEREEMWRGSLRHLNHERATLLGWLRGDLAREIGSLGWRLAQHLGKRPPEAEPGTGLAELRERIAELQTEVARRAAELSDADDGGAGPAIALRRHLERFRQRSGLSVFVRGEANLATIPPPALALGQRVVLAALDNITRHACAERVHIEFRREESFLALTIADDGTGFTESARERLQRGTLAGLDQHLLELGGLLTVDRAVPHGFKVYARVPLAVG